MAGLCLVIQKTSSPLMELAFIFLLCFVPEPALCSPLTAGVNGTVQMFYCEGCAAKVTKVFCKEKNLLDDKHIPNCSGPPQPNSVCQRNGSVFVSSNTSGVCEFEGENYILTKQCTVLDIICRFNDPTSSSTVSLIAVVAPILLLVLAAVVVVLAVYICKKRQTRRPNPKQQSDHDENEVLKMKQRSGDIERSPPADPGSDDDTSPSQSDSERNLNLRCYSENDSP